MTCKELKPCPFCGGTAVILNIGSYSNGFPPPVGSWCDMVPRQEMDKAIATITAERDELAAEYAESMKHAVHMYETAARERDDALRRANNSISAEGAAKLLTRAVIAESRASAAEAANVRLREQIKTVFGAVESAEKFQWDYTGITAWEHGIKAAAQVALQETEATP